MSYSPSNFYDSIELLSSELYVKALKVIPEDVYLSLEAAARSETNSTAKKILNGIVDNISKATDTHAIVCQDTGIPVYHVKIGDRMDINFAKLSSAISRGCARATKDNNLRPNLVHPFTRKNTGTNTGVGMPAIDIESEEDQEFLEITALPKGSGSENCSVLKMLTPADGLLGVKKFILNSIVEAGGKACPPLIVGIGVGGNFESVARLAKRAVFRPVGMHNPDPKLRDLETELLIDMNKLGIGAMGLGGDCTALAVNIEYSDTHISCLPVAINTQCWRGERATGRVFTDGRIEYAS